MSKSAVAVSYGRSLLWFALFMAIAIGVMNVAELTLIDFVHGNPHRPQSNALFMMAVYTPIFGIVGAIGTFLVFTLPQLFQAALVFILSRIFGDRARFAALLALPLTAVLAWYSYDYLTPTDFNLGINTGPDWTPFEHGLSLFRFMSSLAVQAPVTLFSLLYFDAVLCGRSKKNSPSCVPGDRHRDWPDRGLLESPKSAPVPVIGVVCWFGFRQSLESRLPSTASLVI